MRQVLAVCMTLVFVLGLAGAALAQGSQQPSGSAPSAAPSTGGSTTDTTKSTAPSAAPKTDMSKPDATKTDKSAAGKPADKAASGGPRGQHKMMGEVTKIDSAKGMVSLKTDEGNLDLHFPPSALQGIKEGDRVEVQMAIRPAGAAGAGSKPAAGKAPATKTDDATKGSGKAPASTGAPQQPKTQ
jgi:hypothetical protein